jgi:hypothetical protein
VPDRSALHQKIIQNQALLDFGHVDDHLRRALATIAFLAFDGW